MEISVTFVIAIVEPREGIAVRFCRIGGLTTGDA